MVFVVALAIGVAVSMTRSFASIVIAAMLIGVAYGAAAILSPGGASLLSLLMAVAGYNVALAAPVAFLLARQGRRPA